MTRKNIYNNFFDEETWTIVNQDNKDLVDDYLMELKQNKKSDQTQYQYKSDLRGMLCWICKNLNNGDILELTKKDFRKYSLYLTGDCGLSSARHNRLLSSLRSLLTYAENEEEYEYASNTARRIKGLPKEPVRDIVFLSDEQILKLKDELIKREEYQKATLLMLAYDSAGRKAELAQVKKESFLDPNKNNTNKVIGKRRKVFSLLYFSGTKQCVKLWLEQRGEDNIDSLWVHTYAGNKHEATKEDIYNWFMEMRDILNKLEGTELDWGPHSIRHSALEAYSKNFHYFCRELGMKTGFPIEKLKLIANHENIDTTQHYLKDNSVDELAEMFGIKIV